MSRPYPRPPTPLIDDWATAMRAQGLSERVVYERPRVVRSILDGHDPATVTTATVRTLIAARRADWAPSTLANYDTVLRSLFKWLIVEGVRDDDPMVRMRRPRTPRAEPRPITDEHLRLLLTTRMWARTRVMILLAAFAGLRVHEIAKFRGEDLDPIGGWLHIVGKGAAAANLPVHAEIADAANGMPEVGWWFPSYAGDRPIRSDSVSTVISKAMARAGIRGGTAHMLRHWYGTALVSSGADLRTTQTLLRHASLQTTQRYVRVDDTRRVAAIARLDLWRER